MSRWLAAMPLIALVALALLFGLFALKHDPRVEPQALVGKPIPDLVLPTLDDGRPVRLREAARGPLLVNIFASWCAPCEIEHPVLVEMKAQGVPVVGIAYKDAPDNTKAFLNRLGDPYVARLVDRDGRGGIELGVTGVPETYLVGADGMILAKHTGPLTAQVAKDLWAKGAR
ncbi:MAG: DsbE family thiol:disulfide interchange protein [Phenylobacterium sp.]|uniref:DsbE family thiol:disulfide interchange protein n=1 Tax=Phenylobacterium sp. TaxID=1871053 RepID=UPI0027267392|nr:DsbE family thiol:disulfide interchange protein [Phenylobacterium sp.]MDO8910782.1 DsbE family thiol:disulfide interchange protein [Phenylobacterium sp.]MDO9245563.1 DsbE family thiol:disulfide interchange protein [Phenylobacterium sp.]MDP3100990.1 DsbE family thiol:disulfide interchange protein [Phenylobacterium sp.]MDP3632841.1 DsbE family thiol:disulfide interchange protein [Phenylobacterium sp.]HQT52024.1 DsbE family thiol:disulfide interchange protein [Phenylobacterium sp.]